MSISIRSPVTDPEGHVIQEGKHLATVRKEEERGGLGFNRADPHYTYSTNDPNPQNENLPCR